MQNTIVFSDIDGTLLSSDLTITPQTLRAIRQLQARQIPFVIISARSPSGIYPILTAHGFNCPIVAYSGALALDENRQVLAHQGFSKAVAREMIDFIQQSAFDLSWNAFSFDDWVVASRADARVQREESIVHAQAREGSVDSFVQDVVHKFVHLQSCLYGGNRTADEGALSRLLHRALLAHPAGNHAPGRYQGQRGTHGVRALSHHPQKRLCLWR